MKIKKIQSYYQNPEALNADKVDVQEQQEKKEEQKKLPDDLKKKVESISQKLEAKFPNGGKEFFVRNMNDYLKAKFDGAHFELRKDTKGKEEIVLIMGNSKDDAKKLSEMLKVEDNEIYIDENKDGKKDNGEKGVKITKTGMEADNIFVSKTELEKAKKQVGFGKIDNKEGEVSSKETKGGKVVLIDGKDYYQVGDHKDYLAAPIRLFTALSNEYFNGMSTKELSKKIPELGVKKGKNGYEFAKLTDETKKDGFKKVGDFDSETWKKIVKPHSKIDLTSIAEALDIKKIKVPEIKETKEGFSGWGRFYYGAKGEVWDIPNDWKNITYDGYTKDYKGLIGSSLSISAQNAYDENKKNNSFSEKLELGEGKFLLVGEGLSKELKTKLNGKKEVKDIQKILVNSGVEAWLTTYKKGGEKNEILIQEVGDKKVHTVTETSKPVDRGLSETSPIYLSDNNYSFSGDINGNIKFDVKGGEKDKDTKEKKEEKLDITLSGTIKLSDGKILKIEDFKGKDKKKEFEKIFPGGKGYVQLNNKHVIEITYNEKKGIQTKDLGKKEIGLNLTVGGVSIVQEGVKDFEYNKDTKEIKFPKKIGWGEIACKFDKDNVVIENKIGDTEVEIKGIKGKVSPDSLFSSITKSLLYIGTEKVEKKEDNVKYPNGIDYKKENKKISVDITKIKETQSTLLSKLDTKGKISETFIFDIIKENISKEYGIDIKQEEKKDSKPASKETPDKTETKTTTTEGKESKQETTKENTEKLTDEQKKQIAELKKLGAKNVEIVKDEELNTTTYIVDGMSYSDFKKAKKGLIDKN